MDCNTFGLTSTSGATYYFPQPEWGSPDNKIQKDIKLFNMWQDSSIETVDTGINNQPLVIGGVLCIEGNNEGICMPFCPDAFCFSERLSTWLDDFKS